MFERILVKHLSRFSFLFFLFGAMECNAAKSHAHRSRQQQSSNDLRFWRKVPINLYQRTIYNYSYNVNTGSENCLH